MLFQTSSPVQKLQTLLEVKLLFSPNERQFLVMRLRQSW
ncbi:unnamed protein product [Linum tenue]|uniref:Uncharacterized protein n=1 Tax=Linum tenue TaxID=586396 RepID=A0AAV0M4K2_9ROSI|nr:unnamed protein product [Linum tenue]